MNLSKPISCLNEDPHLMRYVCGRIALRRESEANTLPAPDGWLKPKPAPKSFFLRGVCLLLIVVHLAAWIFALALNSAVQP